MGLRLVLLFCLSTKVAFATDDNVIVYDKFTDKPITVEKLAYFKTAGLIGTCTMSVKACNETEGRRTDGSCNNLKSPVTGTYLMPQERLLEACYHNGSYSRLSASGKELPLPRIVRTTLLCEGISVSKYFTQAMPSFGIFAFGDVGSPHDTGVFLVNKTDCCEPEHMNDAMCTPNIIPEDDPVHRFSGIRCLNLTKPLDYQYLGCTNDSTPSPIARATAVVDLNQVYNGNNAGESVIRSYEGGKLATETDEFGVVWPPNKGGTCLGNKGADETRCYSNYPNGLMGVVMFVVWLIRNHNHFAMELAKVNPTWDDDTLYSKARDLNIAIYVRILYKEWLPALTGKDFLIKKGLMTKDGCRRDLYDETEPLKVILEYLYILRYFHIAQRSMANKYDSNGTVTDSFSQTQLALRTGFLGKDDNMRGYTPSTFRQECAAIGHRVDPDISGTGLPLQLQRSVDIVTSDIHKGRTLGMAPYVKYLEYCTGESITCWEDLENYIDNEQIERMKLIYEDVSDIDLMAGAWSEKKIKGGYIGTVPACLLAEYLKKNMITDRFFYERPNRVGAFTDEQLELINSNFTLATLICQNADGVTQVQKEAFKVISKTNPLVDCAQIPRIDFNVFSESA